MSSPAGEPDWAALAQTMPCDEDLLAEVGRVHWAAARLHHGVRDALNAIGGQPSDAPFRRWTLGEAIEKLGQRTTARVDEPDRTALITWCDTVGADANRRRSKVAHAITYTDLDGRQGLRPARRDETVRYLRPQLLEVTGRLVDASMKLPAPPYRLL